MNKNELGCFSFLTIPKVDEPQEFHLPIEEKKKKKKKKIVKHMQVRYMKNTF